MDNLYKVQEEDLEKLKRILTVCFAEDPLYCTLIKIKRQGSGFYLSCLRVI